MEHTGSTGSELSVLGRTELRIDGRPIDLGTPRQRSIIAALALSAGRPVGFDVLVERVWGATPPATAVGTLQRYVASLRHAIEPDRTTAAPTVLTTVGAAYALHTTVGRRDVALLEDGTAEARRLLACVPDPLRPVAPADRVPAVTAAVALLDGVLDLWRGEPYADLGEHDGQVVAERARLHDLRAGASELRLIALLALGRHRETLGDLETMTSLHPLHERWWALRAVALLRSGRQADALAALSTLRELLGDELGVDPSPPLQALYTDILHQAPSLAWPTGPAPGVSSVAHRAPGPVPATAPPRPRWPLVGRDHEAGALARLVTAAGRGGPGTALITGEAGIGKTRLVQESMLAAHAAAAAVVVGRCTEHAPPLWPFWSVLEGLGAGARELEPLRRRPDDFATWRTVAGALRAATTAGPVLVVIEDVHLADGPTLRLLQHLVEDQDLPGLSVVLTRRTKDGDDHRLTRLAAAVARSSGLRLDLTPLAPPEARALALVVDPALPDPDGVGRRSGGNPFFVVELARTGGRIGGGLADVVRTRLTALEPPAQAALQLAAAIDGQVEPDLLAAFLDTTTEDAELALEPALRAGLVHDRVAGRACYDFEHDVVREVLRSGLPASALTRCRETAARLRRRAASTPDVAVVPDDVGRRPGPWSAVMGRGGHPAPDARAS
jgi:DNA-binding SARP family transcriptional activator